MQNRWTFLKTVGFCAGSFRLAGCGQDIFGKRPPPENSNGSGPG